MNEDRLRRALREAPVPDAANAEKRALGLVRSAFAASPPRSAPSRRLRRRNLGLVVAVGLLAALISPAGATVRHWVRDVVRTESPPPLPALTSLPAPGRLLVDSAQGPWVVRGDGSKRLLGSYAQSAWSPHGLYVAAVSRHQLAVVDPAGTIRWTLSRPGVVRNPAWSGDGERIAYLEGRDLRVVAGDGTGDRLLATGVSPVVPAWRPGPARRVAFVEGSRLRVIEVDTGRLLWSALAPPGIEALEWAASGSRLLTVAPGEIDLRGGDGALLRRAAPPPGGSFDSAAIGRGGEVAAVAVMGAGARSALLLFGKGGSQRLLSSPGRLDEVVYSPGGRWLLVTWSSADQWLFLNPDRPRRVVAIADIAAQFAPGTTSPSAFPSVAGWCCAASLGD